MADYTLMGRFVSATGQFLLTTYGQFSCPPTGSFSCPLTFDQGDLFEPFASTAGIPGLIKVARCDPPRRVGPRRVRCITVDRPGVYWWNPHPGPTLLDWPADVRAVADNLGPVGAAPEPPIPRW